VIDTTNTIFRIICGAEFTLKLIGRNNRACVSCACLSMEGSHALFWSSHPVLEFPPPFGDLQAAVIPFSWTWQLTVHSILHRHFFTFLTFVFFECMTVIDRRMSDLMQTHISNSYQIYFHILGMHRNENFCLTPNKMKHWPNTFFRGIFPMYFLTMFSILHQLNRPN